MCMVPPLPHPLSSIITLRHFHHPVLSLGRGPPTPTDHHTLVSELQPIITQGIAVLCNIHIYNFLPQLLSPTKANKEMFTLIQLLLGNVTARE